MKILSLKKSIDHLLDKLASTKNNDKKMILNDVIMESINENEREKEMLLNSLVEHVTYLDTQYNIKWINEAGLRNISPEASIESVLGEKCYKIRHKRNSPCDNCPISATLETGWPWKEEVTYPDGSTKIVSSQAVMDDNGQLKGVIEIELDITIRKDAEIALEKSRQRSRALLDAIPDFLFVFNNKGIFIDYHPASDFDLITETYNPEGKDLTEVMPTILAETVLKQSMMLTSVGSSRNFTFNDESIGEQTYYECRLVKTNPDENVCIIRDISSQKIRESNILYKSFHDSLTGLYNRAYFEEELNRIEQARFILPVSILVIDVNGLKLTNDAFGHDYGDELLKSVASILNRNCRKSDVIARTGGDEFSIILPNSPLSKAIKLSERITNACKNCKYDEIFARPSVSIGCAEKKDNSVSLKDVVKEADENMYKIKLENRDKNHSQFLNDIVETVKKRGGESPRHIQSCMNIAENFAIHRSLSSETIKKIKSLALLHDIGKIRIAERILNKPSQLTKDEFMDVKEHPIVGYRIIKTIPEYAEISNLILYHHEHWDGSGYPSGLVNKDIPLLCRMFSIVESYELMLNGSTYKGPISEEEAIDELLKNSGKQFDPELVKSFIELQQAEKLKNDKRA